ncbi:hypothetical protein [Butyrivibrio sp. LC3010]|uniref:hypothetical protein n=1 Tax=Butyrivibrio sp. LC3010 TaxID=1280680 RepID=UPI00040B87D9|nr:hypothetical protein [Butyrivibrio sp. LC3010]
MRNKILLENIKKIGNTIVYEYAVEGDWKDYFNLNEQFFISYPFGITGVPDSVLAVPFLSNFLPMIWLFDAEAVLPDLDEDFYNKLENLKKGYMEMYPILEFKGTIKVNNVEQNRPQSSEGSAVFFSAGVDAYTTLYRHIEEKPLLVTIWGADVDIDNEEGWRILERGIKASADDYNFEFITIKSSIKKVIDEPKLTLSDIVRPTNEGWWHGFQHGMAIISHMAPIAYLRGLKHSYISSSNPEYAKGTYTCASDPIIDNHMCFCGCNTIHDGYELDRQQKIHYIVSEKEKHNYPVRLHVCWETETGENCCKCEKCYRTILELVSEGADPNEFNFKWSNENISGMKNLLMNKIRLPKFYVETYYRSSQSVMKSNENRINNISSYRWFLNMDMDKFNEYPMKKLRCSKMWIWCRGISHSLRGKK